MAQLENIGVIIVKSLTVFLKKCDKIFLKLFTKVQRELQKNFSDTMENVTELTIQTIMTM